MIECTTAVKKETEALQAAHEENTAKARQQRRFFLGNTILPGLPLSSQVGPLPSSYTMVKRKQPPARSQWPYRLGTVSPCTGRPTRPLSLLLGGRGESCHTIAFLLSIALFPPTRQSE